MVGTTTINFLPYLVHLILITLYVMIQVKNPLYTLRQSLKILSCLKSLSKLFWTSVQNLSFVFLYTLDGLKPNLPYSSSSSLTFRNSLARTNSECPTEVGLDIKVICPAFSCASWSYSADPVQNTTLLS